MTFIELIEHLAGAIGHHHIPVNDRASHVQGLVESSAVHYELIVQIVSTIYSRNACRRLSDPVRRDLTFEALAPVRRKAMSSVRTDVDAIHLIDELGTHIHNAFDAESQTPATPDTKRSATESRGQVIALDRFRQRRVKSWA